MTKHNKILDRDVSNIDISDLVVLDIDELHARRRVLAIEIANALKAHRTLVDENIRIQLAIRAKKAGDVDAFGVSDHAVLRWLERKEGVDVKSIRRRIRDEVIAKRDPAKDDEIVDMGNGMLAAITDGVTVATVWERGDDDSTQENLKK